MRPTRWTLAELERRCQKPDHRRVGNFVARRVARPLALRITWLVQPYGVSAHVATLCAWLMGLAAAVAFGWGSIAGWVAGALLLQAWYLLDHVDGQLARLRRTASLDGAQLDYLMHHSINLALPYGVGYGLFVATGDRGWLLAGSVWGMSLLMIGLVHDARYKAFIQRLKRVEGELRAIGGGGARPEPPPPMPRRVVPFCTWLARKSCEPHVLLNLLSLLALVAWAIGDDRLVVARVMCLTLSVTAVLVATVALFRSVSEARAEQEFAAWYRVGEGQTLVFEDGWWHVESAQTGHSDQPASNGADLSGGRIDRLPQGGLFCAPREMG